MKMDICKMNNCANYSGRIANKQMNINNNKIDDITDEERRKAEKILNGLTWFGDKESLIKDIVKRQRTIGYTS